MRILKLCFTVLLCFSAQAVFAASAAQMLDKKLANFHSLTADFSQVVSSDDGSVLQKSNGKIVILRPGKFHWTVSAPITQDLITDGKTLWIYEPDLEQVTIRQLGSNLSQTPLILLTSQHAEVENTFNVVQQNPSTFILTPKSTQDSFKQIILTFSKDKPQSLVLINSLGQKTAIQFANVAINPTVKMKQFNFKVPQGVDVIDMRKSH